MTRSNPGEIASAWPLLLRQNLHVLRRREGDLLHLDLAIAQAILRAAGPIHVAEDQQSRRRIARLGSVLFIVLLEGRRWRFVQFIKRRARRCVGETEFSAHAVKLQRRNRAECRAAAQTTSQTIALPDL